MTPLIRSEMMKLVGHRAAAVWLALPALLPVVMASLVRSVAPTEEVSVLELLQTTATGLPLVALLFGTVAATGEYRYGSIIAGLTIVPNRRRFLAAKLIASSLVLLAAIGVAVVSCVVAGLVADNGTSPIAAADVAAAVGAMALGAVVFVPLGVCVGIVVRDQTVACVGVLLAVLAGEDVTRLALRLDAVARWLPWVSMRSLVGISATDADPMGGPGVLASLGAVVVVAVVIAAITFDHRDVAV